MRAAFRAERKWKSQQFYFFIFIFALVLRIPRLCCLFEHFSSFRTRRGSKEYSISFATFNAAQEMKMKKKKMIKKVKQIFWFSTDILAVDGERKFKWKRTQIWIDKSVNWRKRREWKRGTERESERGREWVESTVSTQTHMRLETGHNHHRLGRRLRFVEIPNWYSWTLGKRMWIKPRT